jgi:hypothetical protein
MRIFNCLIVSGLAALASAKSTEPKESPKLLDVKLTTESGSIIKVSVKNVGKKKLDFFRRGNLLDENPVHKLEVKSPTGQFIHLVLSNIA